jgi:hypothetical protein
VANRTPRYYREGGSHDAGEISMGVILVLLVLWLALVIIGLSLRRCCG